MPSNIGRFHNIHYDNKRYVIGCETVKRLSLKYRLMSRWDETSRHRKIGRKFGARLAFLLSCGLTGGAAPGLAERAVVDGVEAELVVQSCHQCNGFREVARSRKRQTVGRS